MSNEDNFEDLNNELNEAAYRLAMEYVATTFTTLRKNGLSRRDAASIVAAMIMSKEDEING